MFAYLLSTSARALYVRLLLSLASLQTPHEKTLRALPADPRAQRNGLPVNNRHSSIRIVSFQLFANTGAVGRRRRKLLAW